MSKARKMLKDHDWNSLKVFLPPSREGKKGRPPKDNRLVIEGILWIFRTGAPWRDLHPDFGPWKTVYNRFNRWTKSGLWESIWNVLKKRCGSRIAHARFFDSKNASTRNGGKRR